MTFLTQLEAARLPLRTSDPQALPAVEALLNAKLVDGGVGLSVHDQRRFAVVRSITPLGRAQLALFRGVAARRTEPAQRVIDWPIAGGQNHNV